MEKECANCLHVVVCGIRQRMAMSLEDFGMVVDVAKICPNYLTTDPEKPKRVTTKRRKKTDGK